MNNIDYLLIFRNMPEVCAIVDTDFNIMDITENYIKTSLRSRDELVGKYIFDVFPEDPDDLIADGVHSLKKSFKKIIETRQMSEIPVIRYDILVPNEEPEKYIKAFWSQNNYPVLDENNVKYIIHTVKNVTKDIDNEEQYRLNIEKQNTRDAFFANATHDLRNSINGYIGLISLLHETHYKNEIVSLLAKSSESLLDTTNKLIDFYKGIVKEDTNIIPCNLSELFNNISAAYKYSRKPNISFHNDIKIPKKFTVLCDKVKLERIIHNLLHNSFKFTTKGFVNLVVEIENENTLFCDIIIKVIDSGIGIDKDKLDIIFYEENGLGLKICKNFVELMGGKFSIESDVNVGTTVTININLPFVLIEKNKSA